MSTADALRRARDEFPVLSSCVYLNSNSTGAFPRGARTVLERYWATLESWRDEVWEDWWRELHGYAAALARLVGGEPGTVVTDVNLSSLLGRLLGAMDFRERPVIVSTDLEFPTVPMLLRGCTRRGAEVRVVRSRQGRAVELDDLLPAIDERTRLVCLSHASYATGALVDLEAIVRRAHEVGAWVAVDAYQSVGVVPVDVGALDVDFLLGGAHKWLCGSTESAFLYVHPRHLATLEPPATGWMATPDPLSFSPSTDYDTTARRFASGTPAVLPALLSQVALRIVSEIGAPAIRDASLRLTARILDRAAEAGLEVLTPVEPARRGGIVTLRFADEARVVTQLKQQGVVCSHRGGVRLAPHFYNTEDEVERGMNALISLVRRAR